MAWQAKRHPPPFPKLGRVVDSAPGEVGPATRQLGGAGGLQQLPRKPLVQGVLQHHLCGGLGSELGLGRKLCIKVGPLM